MGVEDNAPSLLRELKIIYSEGSKKPKGIPLENQGKVRSWTDMASFIESFFPNMPESCLRFAHAYFIGQVYIVENKKRLAHRLFNRLENIQGYIQFEDDNQPLLNIIDVAVNGTSRQLYSSS